jgi:hypothetical protein
MNSIASGTDILKGNREYEHTLYRGRYTMVKRQACTDHDHRLIKESFRRNNSVPAVSSLVFHHRLERGVRADHGVRATHGRARECLTTGEAEIITILNRNH